MGFWGFVILDGRRIGYDIDLYRNVGANKIPLTKQELKKVLGDGNPFTEAQKDYMGYVNKHIFGFSRQEQYDQFIRLLIKVRAPKLSKEFKPTKVYEILNDSLQPLSDEDLRAMVEAMEKMDDIQGRLDDLRSAFKDLQTLRNMYNRYNCYMLGKKAQAYLAEKQEVDRVHDELASAQEEQERKAAELEKRKLRSDTIADEQALLNTEKESLNVEELEGTVDKLEGLSKKYQEAASEQQELNDKIERRRDQIRSYDADLRDCSNAVENYTQEIVGLQDELNAENEILQFEHHSEVGGLPSAANKRTVSQQLESQLKVLSKDITAGCNILQKLEEITRRWDQEEQQLSELKEQMLAKEEECKTAEVMEHSSRDQLIESYYKKADEYRELLFEREFLQELTTSIWQYSGPDDYGVIRDRIDTVWRNKESHVLKEQIALEAQLGQVQQEMLRIAAELKQLKEAPEPVPKRKERVEAARIRLQAEGIKFVPFYEALDFAENINQADRDRLECQMADAGLLDALVVAPSDYRQAKKTLTELSDSLICPGELQEDSCAFLQADENLDTELLPVVAAILSNISDEASSTSPFILASDGYFRNGVLEGYSKAEEEASYIGIRARKRKQERLISEKEEELRQTTLVTEQLQEQIEAVKSRIRELQQEYDSLPSFADLDQAISLLKAGNAELEQLNILYQKQEAEVLNWLNQKKQCTQDMITVCKPLPYLRSREAYEEALQAAEDYRSLLRDLGQLCSELELAKARQSYLKEAVEKEEQAIDDDYVYLRKARQNAKELEIQIHHIEELLNNPEIKQKTERLKQLKEELKALSEEQNENLIKLSIIENELNTLNHSMESLKERAVSQIERETKIRNYFQEELELGLVETAENKSIYDAAMQVRDCIKEIDKTRSGIEMTTSLMKTFQEHIGTLTSYGTTMESCFADDAEDSSILRTRQRIAFTWNGKKLYLEEFYDVIKEAIESTELLIQQKDRELFEGILADTLSRKLSKRISESRQWIKDMSELMGNMDTSMGLTFSLDWKPRSGEGDQEMDTQDLEKILRRDKELLTAEDIEKVSVHFRSKIHVAKQNREEGGEYLNYTDLVREALDYRQWFEFKMYYYRNRENRKELTNPAFNRFSGGEKAMAMYVPLFAAVNAQYKKAGNEDHPRIIALDEAFAGVDDKNISSMFELVQKLDFDYIMNSQVLWGCYETIHSLRIVELLRPANSSVVTVVSYYWNGRKKVLDD